MFTGLVRTTGEVRAIAPQGEGVRLTIGSTLDLSGQGLGDSIAVDGVCLTVVGLHEDTWSADVSHETLGCTTLGGLVVGSPVHLEPALRAGDPLGGHLVQGHVDCTGRLESRTERDGSWDLVYSLPAEHSLHLVAKGSIAVDGVSLTVNHCGGDEFGVTIIPHTESLTHLLTRNVGDAVNLETDILGKYVVSMLQRMGGANERDRD